ncbi:MAG: septum formation inhibitor Maf [Acidobacteria bacterium]|nr:septum formation inhibitor Maf [Acidobacteriota bacterium]
MLILASQSPRRQEILRNAGFSFIVQAASVAEIRRPGEEPEQYARRLAREKAACVDPGENAVLAADTIVLTDSHMLGKPTDPDDAARMLRLLSGRDHQVLTAVCLRDRSREIVDSARTRVRFATLEEAEIQAYVASGEPMDKAGAYAIQGLASKFVERIDGCYFNVVGLPVSLVYRLWKTLGKAV